MKRLIVVIGGLHLALFVLAVVFVLINRPEKVDLTKDEALALSLEVLKDCAKDANVHFSEYKLIRVDHPGLRHTLANGGAYTEEVPWKFVYEVGGFSENIHHTTYITVNEYGQAEFESCSSGWFGCF